MAKKIDYAKLFAQRADGRFVAKVKGKDGQWKQISSKDPEELWHRVNDPVDDRVRFSELAENWWEDKEKKIRPGTVACYTALYNRAVEELGGFYIEDILPSDIFAVLERMSAQGYGKATISKQRSLFSSIFRYAIADRRYNLRFSPVNGLSIPEGAKRPVKREAPEKDITDKIQQGARTAHFGEFAMFLLYTGMRRGEALAVRWRDIDSPPGFIRVGSKVDYSTPSPVISEPKTDAGYRKVPICAPLRPFLKRPDGASLDNFLFYGSNPMKPMPKSCYDRRWKHYCLDMGFYTDIPEEYTKNGHKYIRHNYKYTLTAHVLRHAFATILYEADIKEKEAAKIMGHADEEILREVYQHLREKRETEGIQKLLEYTKNGI